VDFPLSDPRGRSEINANLESIVIASSTIRVFWLVILLFRLCGLTLRKHLAQAYFKRVVKLLS